MNALVTFQLLSLFEYTDSRGALKIDFQLAKLETTMRILFSGFTVQEVLSSEQPDHLGAEWLGYSLPSRLPNGAIPQSFCYNAFEDP